MAAGYVDRREAGRALAEWLLERRREGSLVLALPPGGVPVAYEIATALGFELDVLVVRDIALARHPEVTIGAIVSGAAEVLDRGAAKRHGVEVAKLARIVARERDELQRRERTYRGARPRPDVRGRPVILVADGLAEGSTMFAAIEALRQLGPRSVTVAVPVAAPAAADAIAAYADDFVCPLIPRELHAVGAWYRDFDETSAEEVRDLTAQARANAPIRRAQVGAALERLAH